MTTFHKTLFYTRLRIFILSAVLMFMPVAAQAAIPDTMNYQGHLTDSGGNAVNGVVDITFSLYTTPSGGGSVWFETHTGVNISGGLFSVELGGTSPLSSVTFDIPYFLGIQIGVDPEMTPRQVLSTSPYAFQAVDADTVGGISAASLDQSGHVIDTGNPHGVTAAQAGAASSTDLTTHTSDTGNPHGVTAAQTGAVDLAVLGVHTADASAHHTKTSSFAELSGLASDVQIDSVIARDAEIMPTVLANDGAGTTLDADLLDGQHASAFSSSGHNHDPDYVNTAGDTMTGSLTLPANGLVAGTDQLVLSGGNIGVGTTSPDEKLTMPYNQFIGWEYGFTNSSVNHTIGKSSDGMGPLEFRTTHNPGPTGQTFSFFTQGAGGAEVVTILNNGNVGVGTAAPANKLEVVGAVTATSYAGDGSALTGITAAQAGAAEDVHTHDGTSIIDGSITNVDIANGQVTAAKMAANAIASGNIIDGTVATADIKNNAVNTFHILDGEVGTGDLANSSVTAAKLSGVTAADVGADAAGSSATVQGNVDTHTADFLNPHAVTAVQAGADPVGSAATVQTNLGIHAVAPSAHHAKTTSFLDLVDTASDAQIPAAITRDSELTAHAGNAAAHHTRYADPEATAAVSTAYPALQARTGVTGNVAYGNAANLGALTSGDMNTAVGRDALASNTTGDWNTALGDLALNANTIGSDNTAVGADTLELNISGDWNTAVGDSALYSNVNGSSNTAVGGNALWSNLSGNLNTAVGESALLSNEGGSSNTATGANALLSNLSGSLNTAVGESALNQNTAGGSNTATGANTLEFNIDGSWNTAAGINALNQNTTGDSNTATGESALWGNLSGNSNTATGVSALLSNEGGSDNTATGAYALLSNISGNSNTAVGESALNNITNGSNNTALGSGAGLSNNSGSGNVFLGYEAGYSETGSNTLYIANNLTTPLIYGDFAGNAIAIGQGTITAGRQIDTSSGGYLTTAGVWTNASSRALKENIRPLEMADATATIDALEPMRYNYKADKSEEYVGFIAEDVPDLVAVNGRKGLAAMDIVAVITQVVKEQQSMIKAQNERMERLESRIEMLTRAMAAGQVAQR